MYQTDYQENCMQDNEAYEAWNVINEFKCDYNQDMLCNYQQNDQNFENLESSLNENVAISQHDEYLCKIQELEEAKFKLEQKNSELETLYEDSQAICNTLEEKNDELKQNQLEQDKCSTHEQENQKHQHTIQELEDKLYNYGYVIRNQCTKLFDFFAQKKTWKVELNNLKSQLQQEKEVKNQKIAENTQLKEQVDALNAQINGKKYQETLELTDDESQISSAKIEENAKISNPSSIVKNDSLKEENEILKQSQKINHSK